jgi:hypothetical protein
MRERRGVYRILVGEPERNRPNVRFRRTWEASIKMDIQEVGCGAWTGLIWLRTETGGRYMYMRY